MITLSKQCLKPEARHNYWRQFIESIIKLILLDLIIVWLIKLGEIKLFQIYSDANIINFSNCIILIIKPIIF